MIFRGEEKRLIGDLAKASKAGQLQLIQVRKKSGESVSGGSDAESTSKDNEATPLAKNWRCVNDDEEKQRAGNQHLVKVTLSPRIDSDNATTAKLAKNWRCVCSDKIWAHYYNIDSLILKYP